MDGLGLGDGHPGNPRVWWALLQLAALALYVPLLSMLGASRAIVAPPSVWGVGALVALGSFSLYLLISIWTETGWAALAIASVATLFFWNWSLASVNGWLVSLPLFVISVLGAMRIADHRYFKVGSMAASATFTGILVLFVAVQEVSASPPIISPVSEVNRVGLRLEPDIYLIVLDGYGRSDVMREIYGFDNGPFLADLQGEGFEIADRATTNYSITHLAIPALLEMSTVHAPGDRLGFSDQNAIRKIVSGENRLVEILKANGYSYTHGEADRRVNSCGPKVDRCLRGQLLDRTAFELLKRTPLRPLLYPGAGDPNTALNLRRLETLTDWSRTPSEDDSPTFTFLHVLLPHPPMFLDRQCIPRVEARRNGNGVSVPGLVASQLAARRQAWVEQVECANRTIASFIRQIATEDVVVLVSDHGPDSIYRVSYKISDEGLHERMSNLIALRVPKHCRGSVPEDLQLHNVFRVVLACLSNTEIPMLDNRSYIAGFTGPIIEVTVPQARQTSMATHIH